MKIDKIVLIVILLMISFSLTSCDFFSRGSITREGNTLIVKGENYVNEDIVLNPGDTVEFRELFGIFNIASNGTWAFIKFTDNASFIAEGTPSSIITICVKDEGMVNNLIFEYGNLILKYCDFDCSIWINMKDFDTLDVQHCKFNPHVGGAIFYSLSNKGNVIFNYNTINGEVYVFRPSYPEFADFCNGEVLGQRILEDYNGRLEIQYNDIKNLVNPFNFALSASVQPQITFQNNNIAGAHLYAIESSPGGLAISNNYIADCNGKTGVDTTGEQCNNITYSTYRSSPIAEAGCGW